MAAKQSFGPDVTSIVLFSSVTAITVWWRHRLNRRERFRVELACACNQVRIAIDAESPVHLVCYCDDCQGYIAWLDQQRDHSKFGSITAQDLQGGSRTCQVLRSEVSIRRGQESLLAATVLDSALAVRRPQQMLRIHCQCCHTPIFSACWRELTVMGLYAANMIVHEDNDCCTFLAPDTKTGYWSNTSYKLDNGTAIPPPEYRINTKWARHGGKNRPEGNEGFPFFFLLRFLMRNLFAASRCDVPCPIPLPSPGDEVVRYETR